MKRLALVAMCVATSWSCSPESVQPNEATQAGNGGGGGGGVFPPPPPLTCDQQVDALLSTNSYGYVALGYADPTLAAAVDPIMGNFLATNAIAGAPWPGGTISVTRGGRLIFARSYGYGDPTTGMYMEPDSRMRIASVSKSITAMAILKLIHDGQLSGVDTAKPFSLINVGSPMAGGKPATGSYSAVGDPTGSGVSTATDTCSGCSPQVFGQGATNPLLGTITVDELLHHTEGWNRDTVIEPMGLVWPQSTTKPSIISQTLGLTLADGPPTCKESIQYELNQPLQFMPSKYEDYSNEGYCVLGETIAEVTGSSYEDYVQNAIFNPLGMQETTPGVTAKSGQQDREVSYFDFTCAGTYDATTGACENSSGVDWNPSVPIGPSAIFQPTPASWSVFPGDSNEPAPYGGGLYIDTFTAPSAWVSSALDLARFTGAIESHNLPMFAATSADPGWPNKFYTLSERESSYATQQKETWGWYGLGWDGIGVAGSDPNWQANGEFGNNASDPDIYNWWKTGGMSGTSSEIIIHSAGYTVTGLFNGSYPGQSIDSLLETVLSAIIASPAVSFDLFPQYNNAYGGWQDQTMFNATLANGAKMGLYPSRVDGQSVGTETIYPKCTPQQLLSDTCPPPIVVDVQQFRARMAVAPAQFGAATVLVNKTCQDIINALGSGPDAVSGQVVSLQKFYDPVAAAWKYQAVFSAAP
jgi:CubicO group peptidase (beta-lactamase class C family)